MSSLPACRWRSTWYPNVISYGAAHQIREARWLRDPKYWRGHLQTWAENPKPDGVYPSHITPAGPAGTNGTNGATGPQGPAGPQGATGPAGVSSAREVYRDGNQALATTDTTVATMTNVVAGAYVISAKTNVSMTAGGSSWAVTCTLDAGGGNTDTAEDGFDSNVGYVDLDHNVSLNSSRATRPKYTWKGASPGATKR